MKTNSIKFAKLVSPFILCLIFSASEAHSQDLDQHPEESRSTYLPEYLVGPGDVLEMRIFQNDQLDQTLRVSNSGRVHIANVGVISVANLTAAQIEEEIASELRERQLLNDPWVRVRIVEYQSQPLYVVGEVTAPGQFMISGEMRLLDVLGRAGGLTPMAADEGYLLRRQYRPRVGVNLRFESAALGEGLSESITPAATAADPPAQWEGLVGVNTLESDTIRVDLDALRSGNRPELNVRLHGGDVFFLPRRQRQYVYIVGEVYFPGAYGLPREYDHLTASQVVSYAGGPLRTAKSGKAFIMRRDQDGGVEGVPFDFSAIIRGEEVDVAIRPDDIIYVPRSVGRTVGFRMLDLVAHLTQQFLIF